MDLRCAEMQKNFESKRRYAFWHKFLCTEGPKAPASLQDFSSLGFQTMSNGTGWRGVGEIRDMSLESRMV